MDIRIGAWRRTARRGLLATALLALGLPAAQAADKHCAIQKMDMPVRMVGGRAIATLKINGASVPLMVDSGAFFSMLTEAATAQLGLKTHPLPYGMQVQGLVGQVDAQVTKVEHLGLMAGDLPGVEFVVGGNEPGAGAMGMLGRNILDITDIEYDLAHGAIRFIVPSDECAKTNMAYWAGDAPVSEIDLRSEFGEELPAIRGRVLLNGHQVTAVFDTGATTIVSLRGAHLADVKDADMRATEQMIGAGHGKADSWTAAFDRVELGGEAILHNRLEVGDFRIHNADMLIGIDFFLSHRIYVSKQQAKMYFTYNGGPVFALNVGARAAAAASGASAAAETGPALTADEFARRGAAALARRDTAAALADLDRACALEPGNAGFFATRAQVHARMRHYDATLADLETALRLDPAQAAPRMQRAWMRTAHDERERALDDLAQLDRTLPAQAPMRLEMARLYEQLGHHEEVIAQADLWIAAHPHDIALEQAWNARCWARVELGVDLARALDDCDNAVDADEKNASYLDSRAWVYLRQGKLKKSLADFDRGLAIRPDGVFSLYGRGLAHLGLGDAALAQADLAAARKKDPAIDEHIRKTGLPSAPAAAPGASAPAS
jgi:tetratricopeptide (TPR) repeat protein/predicted aspartyl protease